MTLLEAAEAGHIVGYVYVGRTAHLVLTYFLFLTVGRFVPFHKALVADDLLHLHAVWVTVPGLVLRQTCRVSLWPIKFMWHVTKHRQ